MKDRHPHLPSIEELRAIAKALGGFPVGTAYKRPEYSGLTQRAAGEKSLIAAVGEDAYRAAFAKARREMESRPKPAVPVLPSGSLLEAVEADDPERAPSRSLTAVAKILALRTGERGFDHYRIHKTQEYAGVSPRIAVARELMKRYGKQAVMDELRSECARHGDEGGEGGEDHDGLPVDLVPPEAPQEESQAAREWRERTTVIHAHAQEWLYAFEWEDRPGIVKVGRTSEKDPAARFEGLKTGSAFPPVLLAAWQVEDSAALERRAHEALTQEDRHFYRGWGTEWFRASAADVRRVVSGLLAR